MIKKTFKFLLSLIILIVLVTSPCIFASSNNHHLENLKSSNKLLLENENNLVTCNFDGDVRKYYYNQLTLEEQEMYNVIDSSKQKIFENEELLIGTIDSKYNTAMENATNLIHKVLWAYRLDNPISTIWLNSYKLYLKPVNTNGNITTFSIIMTSNGDSYYNFNNKDELLHALDIVESKTQNFVQSCLGQMKKNLSKFMIGY